MLFIMPLPSSIVSLDFDESQIEIDTETYPNKQQ